MCTVPNTVDYSLKSPGSCQQLRFLLTINYVIIVVVVIVVSELGVCCGPEG